MRKALIHVCVCNKEMVVLKKGNLVVFSVNIFSCYK